MPPAIALYVTLACIFFLFWHELRGKKDESLELWIPLIWFIITGSRFVSQWLSMVGVNVGAPSLASSLEDGSPIDRLVFIALIAAGFYVLSKRRVQLAVFARQNVWLTVFFAYCFLSICWSDSPFIAFKRFIKVLGHPIMILIILTEANPQEAVRRVLKRCGFLLVPLSILLGKYFPQYGREYNYWTGAEYYVGVTTAKNTLGHMCMIFGIFYFWDALQALRIKKMSTKLYQVGVSVGFLAMSAYLLKMAASATSLVTMMIGICTIAMIGLPFVNKRHIGVYFVGVVLALAFANSMFGIYGAVVHGLGRNMTLTGRTNIWQMVIALQSNPILGVGFESFWLGDRLKSLWSTEEGQIGESHNGYLETYLNLGFVGLIIFLAVLLSTYGKIRLDLLRRFEFGQLRMGLFVAILIYNFTEAAFVSVHLIYSVFFLIAIEYSTVRKSRIPRPSEGVRHKPQNPVIWSGARS